MFRTIIETIEKLYTSRILHNVSGRGGTFTENCMLEMTFSEKCSFEGWILKVNIVLGTINVERNCVCFSVMDYKV